MPSPVGHALGAIAAGWRAVPARTQRGDALRAAVVVAGLGVAPDLDLLFHDHRGPAHSVGAAMLVALIVALVARSWRWGLAAGLAWVSHVGLDWLGVDNAPPIGLMALWPFSYGYYQAPLHVFPAVSRSFGVPQFWIRNITALIVELCVIGPVAVLVAATSRWRSSR
jgi:membrane-bound metal-dependent hydrolase YbcI (DUF457 family)